MQVTHPAGSRLQKMAEICTSHEGGGGCVCVCVCVCVCLPQVGVARAIRGEKAELVWCRVHG